MKAKQLYYKAGLACSLLLLLVVGANANELGGIEKTKKVVREYKVDSKDRLSIENKYGTVEVNTWDKSEIKVEVTIRSTAETADNAQKQLDRVTIEENRTDDEIGFVTEISSTNLKWGRGEKRSLEINYLVFMPKSNPLTIENKYGATKVPDFSGPLNISDSYGSFTGGNLGNTSNTIEVKYGNATISSINRGTLDISYSGLKLQKADNLTLSHRYGNLELGDVDNLTANIDYSSAKINKINESGTITTKYCNGIKLMNIGRSLKNLTINSQYAGVNLGFDSNAAFDFSVNVSYGDFNYDKSRATNITQPGGKDDDEDYKPTKVFSGKYGTGPSNGKIAISVKYGSVKFD